MKTEPPLLICQTLFARWLPALLCLAFAARIHADTVELVNGDHYSGTVLSVSMSNVSFRSEIQGLVVLPRGKVAKIAFSPSTAKTNALPTKAVESGNTLQFSAAPTVRPQVQSPVRLPVQIQPPAQLQNHPRLSAPTSSNPTDVIGQIQSQLLSGAGPQANQAYTQMATALLGGNLSVPEIRKQAQETLSAVEQATRESGPEMDSSVEDYVSILKQFLQETAPK